MNLIHKVIVITLITAVIGYFNEYTRMPMSELVRRLVGKCGPADDSLLWYNVILIFFLFDLVNQYFNSYNFYLITYSL
jgi:hypothetical protein